MILLLLIAVVCAVGLFLLLLPHGLFIALAGASLGSSTLTAIGAIAIAQWGARRDRVGLAAASPEPRPEAEPVTRLRKSL